MCWTLLDRLTRQAGKNLILVTHSPEAAAYADRVFALREGHLVRGSTRYEPAAALFPLGLWNVGWRYLLRHRWQSALMILGIALGVAVVVADRPGQCQRQPRLRAEHRDADRAGHPPDHRRPAGAGRTGLRRSAAGGLARPAAPVVSDYVSSPQLGGRPLQLLGIDPFAEAPFRGFLGEQRRRAAGPADRLPDPPGRGADLAPAGRALRAASWAAPLEIQAAGRKQPAFVAGLLEPADNLSQRTLDGVMLADISTAQELTGRLGRLEPHRPDPARSDPDCAGQLEASAAAGSAAGQPAAARSSAVEQMTAAFRLNLTALSLLALVVGLFLIYNTMTFSVVQRRELFGTLRCLGVTRREVFAMVLGEAAAGRAAGSGAGHWPGRCCWARGRWAWSRRRSTTCISPPRCRPAGISAESLVKGGAGGAAGHAVHRRPAGLGGRLHPAAGGAAALRAGEQGAPVRRLGGAGRVWRVLGAGAAGLPDSHRPACCAGLWRHAAAVLGAALLLLGGGGAAGAPAAPPVTAPCLAWWGAWPRATCSTRSAAPPWRSPR